MLNKILEKLLQNKNIVLAIFALICFKGFVDLINLPIDAIPDITNAQVVISTKTKGLSPEQIERTITYKIETEIGGIPGVEEVRSISKYGLSQVVVVFSEKTNLYLAREQVNQKIQTVKDSLPTGVSPELGPVSTGLGEVLIYSLKLKDQFKNKFNNENDKLTYLKTIQDYTIRPQLKKLAGIADVDSIGGFKREIHINIDPEKLKKYGLTIENLTEKLNSVGENYGGGYIENNNKQIIVRTSGNIKNYNQIGLIPIKINFGGKNILLKDLAEVSSEHALRLGSGTLAGNEALIATVLMYIGSNGREVVNNTLKEIRNLHLPDDVEIEILYNRNFLINSTIKTVIKNLSEGILLVLAVIFLFLGNIRAGFAIAIAIPFSILILGSGMTFFGISANLMSLGALDFGLLVDASIVVIENCLRYFSQNPHEKKSQIIIRAVKEIIKPVCLGILIIMSVYIPILYLEGAEGKTFKPMAITVLIGLFASLAIAFFIMPILALIFLKNPRDDHKDTKFFIFIEKIYQKTLNYCLKNTRKVIIFSVTLSAISITLLFKINSEFMPILNEGDLVMEVIKNSEISLSESTRIQKEIEISLLKNPEITKVFSRTGSSDVGLDPAGFNVGDVFIILDKKKLDQKTKLIEKIKQDIKKQFPDLEFSIIQPIQMRFNELLEGSRADVSLRLFGQDPSILINKSEEIEKIINQMPEVSEAGGDAITSLKKSTVLDINLNYEAINKYGINILAVNRNLEIAMSGLEVGSFYENDLKFPISMHLDESLRNDVKNIKNIPIGLQSGSSIPLGYITEFSEEDQVTTISRRFGKRYSAISIFLNDVDIEKFIKKLDQKIKNEIHLDDGYYIEYGGKFKQLQRAKIKLGIMIPIILIIIFLILFESFGRIWEALIIFSGIPFAISGGIFALYLTNISLSISAIIGFIALFGISILNNMVLVDFIDKKPSIKEACLTRLKPVLMTALVAALGFVPMAINNTIGSEVQKPLAMVVIGGIITSTIMTLIVTPLLCNILRSK